MSKCDKCGADLTDDCIVVWKCSECGKAFKVNLPKLHKMQKQKQEINKKNLLKCSNCGHILDDRNEEITCKCSICGNIITGNLDYFMNEKGNENHMDEMKSAENVNAGFIKCPECGKEIKDAGECCPECGYTIPKCDKEKDVNKKSYIDGLRSMRTAVVILAVICFIVSGVFFGKGYNVKNEYYNSDYTRLNKNAYVGGDAYNYIINGTYFTGYSVIASAALLSGMILMSNSIMITMKMKEYE